MAGKGELDGAEENERTTSWFFKKGKDAYSWKHKCQQDWGDLTELFCDLVILYRVFYWELVVGSHHILGCILGQMT